jgi:hypothetical protein
MTLWPVAANLSLRGLRRLAPALTAALALGACGGGASGDGGTTASDGAGAAPTSPADESVALPSFHLAPLVLDAPSNVDADGSGSSAFLPPHTQALPRALAALDSARLTPERIDEQLRRMGGPGSSRFDPQGSTNTPFAVLTPAQIRAAYRLPALPVAASALSATQSASLGSGQTIYLIDAHSSPTVAADLATFNTTFGLPGCSIAAITAASHLPLAQAAAGSGCTLSIAYVDAKGALTDAAPTYDSSWAVEIGMDVQWAHATAPMARIVVLEAPSASVAQLAAAVQLANAMGEGVVSMSFAVAEGAYMASLQDIFLANGTMSYVASTGDAGAGVAWPSASPSVLAVGGTSLIYTGSGWRSESAWSKTGGGISAYEVEPAYQRAVTVRGDPVAVAGSPPRSMRSVADVSFNADPNSGQYLIVTPSGAASPSWYSGGGTSIGAPQWAGLLAVANAQRAQVGKPALGAPHPVLYERIAAVRGLYAGALLDVTTGRDGRCAACAAGIGYDAPTGLGTPNGTDLLSLLAAY